MSYVILNIWWYGIPVAYVIQGFIYYQADPKVPAEIRRRSEPLVTSRFEFFVLSVMWPLLLVALFYLGLVAIVVHVKDKS